MGYRFARFLIRILLRLFTHTEIQGLENIPRSGGVIIASNHVGRLEVPLAYYFSGREDIFLLVAEKYRSSAIFRWFTRRLNGIFVDRFGADFSAMREALKRLQQGQLLVAAPEGTRSPTGTLLPGRPGLSYLAMKAGVPVLPVGVTGTEDARVKAQLLRLRRPHICVQVGKPFLLPPVKGKDREAGLQQYTDEIMCRIAALLPPAYRGVYADHPRTKELLKGVEGFELD